MKTLLLNCIFLSLCSQTQAKFDKVKVGSSPVLSSIGLYLAEEKGFFKEQRIDVELIDFAASGGSMTMLLANNQLDIGAGNITAGLYSAFLKGEKFKIVADKGHIHPSTDYIGLLVRSDLVSSGRYKSLASLKGFKVGLTSLGGVSQQIVFERMLASVGLTRNDVTYIKMSYSDMNIALMNKQLDAAIQLEPLLSKAISEKYAQKVAKSSDFYSNQQSAALFFSPNFVKSKSDLPVRFLTAYLKGIRLYNEALVDPNRKKEVFSAVGKKIKIDDQLIDVIQPVGLRNDGRLDLKSLQEDISWYFKNGFIESDLDVKLIVDESFIQLALKKIDGK